MLLPLTNVYSCINVCYILPHVHFILGMNEDTELNWNLGG